MNKEARHHDGSEFKARQVKIEEKNNEASFQDPHLNSSEKKKAENKKSNSSFEIIQKNEPNSKCINSDKKKIKVKLKKYKLKEESLKNELLTLRQEGESKIQKLKSQNKKLKSELRIAQEKQIKSEVVLEALRAQIESLETIKKIAFKSKGLKNFGTTCYINSVLQILAHLEEFNDMKCSLPFNKQLNELLLLMINPSASSGEIMIKLDEFNSLLFSESHQFEKNMQGDPKYLLIYIQKSLLDELNGRNSLFRWVIKKEFVHQLKKSKMKNSVDGMIHRSNYPEQVNNIFALNPKDRRITICDFISAFSMFFHEKSPTGFCEECNKNEEGQERIEFIRAGSYAIFSTISSKFGCDLREIESFSEFPYVFKLSSIIMRQGSENIRGHNYSICKEQSHWVEYNDSLISPITNFFLDGPYIFLYTVNQLKQ